MLSVVVILSVLSLESYAQVDSVKTDSLSSRLNELIKHKLPSTCTVGISIYDLTAKHALYTHQADKLSRPASTMKLLTLITAFAAPHADEPFRTEVWYDGTLANDTLHGDVYVVGGFDPEFDDEALDSLVSTVSRFPFSVLQGRIYGDVSLKDSLYWGSGWLWDDTPNAFQPYLSPLMLDKGVVTVAASPGLKGDSARLKCTPASTYYTLINHAKTGVPSAGPFQVSRNWLEGGNDILVTGNVENRQAGTVNIPSSQDFFMHTFVERLQAKGIRLVHPGYAFSEFPMTDKSVRMAAHETPMQTVANQLMKESDNLNAEAVLCRLGAQTTGRRHISAEDGLSAVRALVRQLGYNPDHYGLADGCGLSHYDYLSPELLTAFLRYAYSRTDVFRKLYKSLPIGGIDGTLKYRMRRGTPSYRNVRAKTGSYTGVNCLAGYLTAENGHQIAFAIMVQNILSARVARAFQDAVCDEIIR